MKYFFFSFKTLNTFKLNAHLFFRLYFRHSLIFTNHQTYMYIGKNSFNSMNQAGHVLNDYLSLNGDDGAEI